MDEAKLKYQAVTDMCNLLNILIPTDARTLNVTNISPTFHGHLQNFFFSSLSHLGKQGCVLQKRVSDHDEKVKLLSELCKWQNTTRIVYARLNLPKNLKGKIVYNES